MSANTINIYNYTGYKNIFIFADTDNVKSKHKLACASSDSIKLTIKYTDSTNIYCTTSDGKYVGNIIAYNNRDKDISFDIYIDLNGKSYDCDGNILQSKPTKANPYLQLSLILTSNTNIGNNISINGDGTVTYKDKTYDISNYNKSSNTKYIIYAIIILIIIIISSIIAYIIFVKRKT